MRNGLAPTINIEFDRPDGTSYKRDMKFGADEFSAAKDRCDVKIAHNYFRGDLEHYEIHVRDERIDVKLDVVRTTDSWRADTGHQFFGEKRTSSVPGSCRCLRAEYGPGSRSTARKRRSKDRATTITIGATST